ncbi:gustatory and odorant receptor 24 [Cryptotermes secundus]|uniref:gustatory and odorant receptor 24 n=1 Tax=Cryptotermes secundus TaxID=105785 RepID=UPI000CD7AF95|nr:gustatory and odorant receptor 24 [Cryptotermes secundus]
MKHRNHKQRPRFALKWRRHGGRVSAGTDAGTFLAHKPMSTVDSLSYGMKPTSYEFSRSDVSQFCGHSPHGYALNPYYDSLKPLLLVMRAMGVLPLTSEAGGAVVFSWMSLAMLYSACLYWLLCLGVWFTNENRMQAIREANGRFEDSVDAYMLFVYLVPLVHLPFTHWREAAKVARYLNDWSTFQSHYRQVTGANLVLPLKRRCLTAVLLTLSLSHISILASCGFVIAVKNIPDEILYSYLVSLMNTLDKSPMWATVLAQYRLLWLDLSHLATQTGAASCYTCGCYLVHQFLMVATSAYATLSDAIAGNFDSRLLSICATFSASMILAICEGANNVFLKANVAFQKKLLRLQTATYNKETNLQVSTFLQTISAEPPVISLGGYVRINRELLVAVSTHALASLRSHAVSVCSERQAEFCTY